MVHEFDRRESFSLDLDLLNEWPNRWVSLQRISQITTPRISRRLNDKRQILHRSLQCAPSDYFSRLNNLVHVLARQPF